LCAARSRGTYLQRDGADPTADPVGYRQGILWLSPDKLTEMVRALREVLASRADNGPAPNRRPHLVSPIFFPVEEPRLQSIDQHADQPGASHGAVGRDQHGGGPAAASRG
jgi:hypothetical protein